MEVGLQLWGSAKGKTSSLYNALTPLIQRHGGGPVGAIVFAPARPRPGGGPAEARRFGVRPSGVEARRGCPAEEARRKH